MARTRTNRRLEHPREQVMHATLEMVAEQGLATVTVAALAARLGTSGGHLLYYFGTRDGILLETLRWVEQQYAEQRAPILRAASPGDAPAPLDAVLRFAEVYLPVDQRDPRWLLWLELWARAPYDPQLAAAQQALDEHWHADLVAVLAAARPHLPDHGAVSVRLRAMWDGFAIQIVSGGGVALRDAVLAHSREMVDGS